MPALWQVDWPAAQAKGLIPHWLCRRCGVLIAGLPGPECVRCAAKTAATKENDS